MRLVLSRDGSHGIIERMPNQGKIGGATVIRDCVHPVLDRLLYIPREPIDALSHFIPRASIGALEVQINPGEFGTLSHARNERASAIQIDFWSSKPSTHGNSSKLPLAFDFAMTSLGRERSFFRLT